MPSSRLLPRTGVRRFYNTTIPVLYMDVKVERVPSNSTAFVTSAAVERVPRVLA